MPLPFLSARWSNLFLLTYAVPPELLEHRLAPGLTLDTRDGQAFVSLVAFDFLDTRVLGVPWPGFRNFAELNLRFYVRRGAERGVMFVREFVPQHLVAWVARTLYNEPYRAAPLQSVTRMQPGQITIEHTLRWAGAAHTITATGATPAQLPPEDSAEHFFKEHQWGYGRTRGGRLLRYQVRHPFWQTYPVLSYRINLDWASVYGAEWAMLARVQPYSAVLALGSPVQVFFGGTPGA
jgi:uncharacterized protein YqjF (DUF2071 family)